MKLEEVLPEYRKGREYRHTASKQSLTDFLNQGYICRGAMMADCWELLPKPPVVIDLVQYADGYEFDHGGRNYLLSSNQEGKYSLDHDYTFKVLGCVYMTQCKAHGLVSKLNSGEWVLK